MKNKPYAMQTHSLLVRKFIFTSVVLCLCFGANLYAQLSVINPSFEGPTGPGLTPNPWTICGGGTPDTQPGAFGCALAASNGSTYVGVVSGGGAFANEQFGQTLSSPMASGVAYKLKLDYAYCASYSTNSTAGKLTVYAASALCGTNQVIWTSPTATTSWQSVTVTFTPNANYPCITFANIAGGLTNVLVDNLQPIVTALPVELMSFNATLKNGSVQLTWTTAIEENAREFIIEKSADGMDFTSIGSIQAHGNSVITQKYSYKDPLITGNVSYYRLKQVDFDEKAAYSHVISTTSEKTFENISISPQPIKDQVEIAFYATSETSVMLKVFNSTGSLVHTYNNQIQAGANSIRADLSALPQGLYLLSLQDSNGQIALTKIVKE